MDETEKARFSRLIRDRLAEIDAENALGSDGQSTVMPGSVDLPQTAPARAHFAAQSRDVTAAIRVIVRADRGSERQNAPRPEGISPKSARAALISLEKGPPCLRKIA